MEYSNSRMIEIVKDYIHHSRDRRIMLHKYVEGDTLEKIAEDFDLSVSQVKRIVRKNSDIVFRHMKED